MAERVSTGSSDPRESPEPSLNGHDKRKRATRRGRRHKREEDEHEMKAHLEHQLEQRPDRAALVRRNVLKDYDTEAAPKLASVMATLTKHRMENKLKHLLNRRSSMESLVEKNILPTHGPAVEQAQRQIKRQADKERLSEFLTKRPSLYDVRLRKVVEDTMTWTREIMAGAMPMPRNCHSMTAIEEKLYLMGGFGSHARSNELLVYDTVQCMWERPITAGVVPSQRYAHTCVSVGSRLVLFGGFCMEAHSHLNDVNLLDTDFVQAFTPSVTHGDKKSKAAARAGPTHKMLMWYQPEISGTAPCPRAGHTANTVGCQMFVFGGNDGSGFFNDLFVLDIEELAWVAPTTKGTPPSPRAGHTTTLVNNHLVVFGGADQHGATNSTHALDLETMTWHPLQLHGTAPSPRGGHSAVCTVQGQLLVFGGGLNDKVYNDLHLLDIGAGVWSRPSDTGTLPVPRCGHSCTPVGGRLYIFGGGDANTAFNDLHILDTTFMILPSSAEGVERMRSPSVGDRNDTESVHFSQEEADLVVSKIDNTTKHIESVLAAAREHIDRKQHEQKLKEQQFLAMFKLSQDSQREQFEMLHEEIKTVQEIVMAELKALKSEFLLTRRRSSTASSSSGHRHLAQSPHNRPTSPHSAGPRRGDGKQRHAQQHHQQQQHQRYPPRSGSAAAVLQDIPPRKFDDTRDAVRLRPHDSQRRGDRRKGGGGGGGGGGGNSTSGCTAPASGRAAGNGRPVSRALQQAGGNGKTSPSSAPGGLVAPKTDAAPRANSASADYAWAVRKSLAADHPPPAPPLVRAKSGSSQGSHGSGGSARLNGSANGHNDDDMTVVKPKRRRRKKGRNSGQQQHPHQSSSTR